MFPNQKHKNDPHQSDYKWKMIDDIRFGRLQTSCNKEQQTKTKRHLAICLYTPCEREKKHTFQIICKRVCTKQKSASRKWDVYREKKRRKAVLLAFGGCVESEYRSLLKIYERKCLNSSVFRFVYIWTQNKHEPVSGARACTFVSDDFLCTPV